MELIASIDQGTQSTRCTFYNRNLRVVTSAQENHTQHFPKSGWVEHDALEIMQATKTVMLKCVDDINERNLDVKIMGFGITNQRETVVAWDKNNGRPYCNAIVWYDTRTKDIAETHKKVDIDFPKLTGLFVNTYFSAVKIRWMIENVPAVQHGIKTGDCYFGTIDSWLIWNLTGGKNGGSFVTDVTNASRTLLMDISKCAWSPVLLKNFGVPESCLPKIQSCAEVYGHIKGLGSKLLDGVPVSGSAGDQQASCIGQGLINKGEVKCTFGTGCFILINAGSEVVTPKGGLLGTVCYQFGKDKPVYALEGSVATVGSGVSWLKNSLKVIETAAETEEILNCTPDSEDVYFVPAFSGLFAPYWRQDARGAIVGMTQSTTKNHVVRAFLESIGFNLREVVELMGDSMNLKMHEIKIRIDGGMTGNKALMKLCCELCGSVLERPINQEATSLGAAIAAGIGVKMFSGMNDPAVRLECTAVHRRFVPTMSEKEREKKLKRYQQAVEKSFNWV